MTTKKMSKQSVAILILSVFLLIAVAFGATAAWFTVSDKNDVTVNTGKLVASVYNGDVEWTGTTLTNSVPGDTVIPGGLKVKSATGATTIPTYIRITVKATTPTDVTFTVADLPAGWFKSDVQDNGFAYYYYGTSTALTEVKVADLEAGVSLWTDAATWNGDNDAMGKEITVTITADVIQAGNIANKTEAGFDGVLAKVVA